mmetsp:Transcript_58280/g.165724  ORF Transcript_58280/g.165724 Transcript_58280/m.165724 type:complete len:315 (-) Transcript_58280:677-1621(-)
MHCIRDERSCSPAEVSGHRDRHVRGHPRRGHVRGHFQPPPGIRKLLGKPPLLLEPPSLLRLQQAPAGIRGPGLCFREPPLEGAVAAVGRQLQVLRQPLQAVRHPLKEPRGQDLRLCRACRLLQVTLAQARPVVHQLIDALVRDLRVELAHNLAVVEPLGHTLALAPGEAQVLSPEVLVQALEALRQLGAAVLELGVRLVKAQRRECGQRIGLRGPVDLAQGVLTRGQARARLAQARVVVPRGLPHALPQRALDDRGPGRLDRGHGALVDGPAVLRHELDERCPGQDCAVHRLRLHPVIHLPDKRLDLCTKLRSQ